MLAHDAKLVLSLSTLTGYRDLIDPFRSLTVSRVSLLMLFIALPVPFAKNCTIAKQEDD